jgi:Flp pilus assembly protein TadD
VNAALILSAVFSLDPGSIYADNTHTIRGVVVTPDGTLVPEFTVTVRPVVDKPKLINRRRFKNGEFTLEGLNFDKYQITITAPRYVGVKLEVDFASQSSLLDHRIAILHYPRSGSNLTADETGYAGSAKSTQQKIPEAAKAAYQTGVALHREGRLDEALVEYGKALRLFPNYIDVLGDLGAIYLLYNRPDSALAYLHRALEIDGSNTAVRLNVAVASMMRGDYSEATNNLEQVLRVEPHNSLPMYYMAKLQFLQKKYGPAQLALRKALAENPVLLDGWLLLVDIALQQQDYATVREGLMHLRASMNNGMFSKFIDEQLSALGNSKS